MTNEYTTTSTTWWIAHNNDDILHYSKAEPNTIITTGQPTLETFDNKIDWEKRIIELSDPIKTDSSGGVELNVSEQEIEDMEYDTFGLIDHLLFTTSVDGELYENGSPVLPEQRLMRFNHNPSRRS